MRPQIYRSFGGLTVLSLLMLRPSPRATAQPQEHVIFAFTDCWEANAALIRDERGNFYGTTLNGGMYKGGCVFELSPNPDGSWTETTLHSFSRADGYAPGDALVRDNHGNLYGTTRQGGLYGGGVAFELSPSQSGTWTFTALHSFGNGADGSDPVSQLVFDFAGNLYGTTEFGGLHRGGTVFRLSPGPNGWTETILHSFWGRIQGPAPSNPVGGVVMDSEGNLYGVTSSGGKKGASAQPTSWYPGMGFTRKGRSTASMAMTVGSRLRV